MSLRFGGRQYSGLFVAEVTDKWKHLCTCVHAKGRHLHHHQQGWVFAMAKTIFAGTVEKKR